MAGQPVRPLVCRARCALYRRAAIVVRVHWTVCVVDAGRYAIAGARIEGSLQPARAAAQVVANERKASALSHAGTRRRAGSCVSWRRRDQVVNRRVVGGAIHAFHGRQRVVACHWGGQRPKGEGRICGARRRRVVVRSVQPTCPRERGWQRKALAVGLAAAPR